MRSGSVCFGFLPDKATSYCWWRQYMRCSGQSEHFGFERVRIIAPKSIIA